MIDAKGDAGSGGSAKGAAGSGGSANGDSGSERPAIVTDGGGRRGADSPLHDAYATVVYDLDGTLVDLLVDWAQVAQDVIDVYGAAGVETPSDDLWTLLEAAPEYGLREDVEAAIATHEHEGARTSTRLPLAEGLTPGLASRTAVCSLNCEEACRIALEAHGVSAGVGAVVGRDTVATHKPDPTPLLAAIEDLGGDPESAVFVGDSDRDAVTADRAGVDFRWASTLY